MFGEEINMMKYGIKRKHINLKDYLGRVPKKKELFCDITIKGTKEEIRLLEKFCEVKVINTRYKVAWSYILYSVAESLGFYKTDNFLSDKILNHLIDNDIALIDLGHFNLSDQWLQKIYDKNNDCEEAMQTIELRKKNLQ